MNEYLRNKVSEVVSSNNIAYILNDDKEFSLTGYKVMQNQSSIGLLQCAKIMYNGKIKLVYLVGNYKPLSYVVSRVGLNELNAVIFNLIQRVIDIKANGFFKAENIELDFNKIFVDISDYSVHFVYFPLAGGVTGKISAFENEFRIALISLFNSFPVFKAPVYQHLCSDLTNGALTLETIIIKMQENFQTNKYSQQDNLIYREERSNSIQSNFNPENGICGSNSNYIEKKSVDYFNKRINFGGNNSVQENALKRQEYFRNYDSKKSNNFGDSGQNFGQVSNFYQNSNLPTPMSQPTMTISSVNSPVQISLTINTPEYFIGKNPERVDGAITFNPAISRVHCKITFNSGKYYLTDLDSANGTFLNQQRLTAQQTLEIHNGDYLQLANSDFTISY